MIGLHMLVKDEQELLPALLDHLKPWVQEMVIVDTGSTDNTVVICKERGATVVSKPLDHDFAAARNAGLELITEPWVFQVDADEWPEDALLCYMARFLEAPAKYVDALLVRRHNLIDGQPIGERTYEWHPRVFRNTLRFEGAIHERLNVNNLHFLPPTLILRHYKTSERQERQNRFYQEWNE